MSEPKATESPRTTKGAEAIDIHKLADKVYRLMLADLRLDTVRHAKRSRGKEQRP
jgi:hypothetical protein